MPRSPDEIANLCRRALYVKDLNYKVKVPTNGHEYIQLVRAETKKIYPDTGKFHEAPPYVYIRTPDDQVNSIGQWKRRSAVIFTDFALELKSKKSFLKKKFPQQAIPSLDDVKELCLFCLGSSLYRRIFISDNVDTVDGHPPFLSYVLHLSQDDIFAMIQQLIEWGEQVLYDNDLCSWIYALLACLEKPISDEWSDYLEIVNDTFEEKSKAFEAVAGTKRHQLRLLSAILRNYFCVKAYSLGPSLDRFARTY